uniref:U4/U6 snRNA-associated-splicing factor PRP24 n=1 Tax=Kalmanozyma brasiliensis (strain GHG001) TaxID=1365824 RepID=V5ESA2_KALBG
MNHILALLDSYRNAAQRSTLLSHDWDVFLALETRLAAATGPLTPDSLQALFQLHNDATSHVQSIDLIRRYISLLLAYFSKLSGINVALPPMQSAEGPSTSGSNDPASKWTSLGSCPTIDVPSSTYIAASLPQLSQDSVDAADWEPVCGVEAVRWRIREAYTRCAAQLQESQDVWRLYLAFEEALLPSSLVAQDQQLETVRYVYLARLKVPHTAIDEIFQAFSSFVTKHLPPQQYENEMSAANVLVAESRAILRQREQHEDALASLFRAGKVHTAGSRQDLDHFAAYCKPYLRWQSGRAIRAMRSKDKAASQTELDLACGLFERLIPHFGVHPPSTHKHELVYYSDDVKASEHYAREFKRLSHEEREARTQQEQQLFSERHALATDLWLDYLSVLTSSHRPDASLIMDVCTRAVHCLPTAVSLHCALMRNSARFRRSRPQIEQLFENVVTPGALELKASELTDLCLARIDCERELASFDLVVKAGADLHIDPAQDMDKFTEIYALLSYSLGKLAELGDDRDPSLRLEKATVNWVERAVFAMGGPASEGGAGFNELAESVWQTAVAQQPDNALVYREAAGYWLRRFDAGKARGWFKAGVSKLERRQSQEASPEYQTLLQEWVQFEHQHGSIEEVEYAEGKARAERQRALEAWYASYAQYGYQAESQAQIQAANGHDDSAMQVEVTSNHAPSSAGKRKAEDEEDADTSIADAPMLTRTEPPPNPTDPALEQPKKTRTTDADTAPSRDREHCSVLLSNLDPSTDASSIRTFLRGCGRVIELTGPTILGSTAAALVEFADPLGASSALTRHNKPLTSTMVSIHIGWKCTLFVTNFPEDWDDTSVRDTFSPHGLIFTVRWPSKRFVSSRRFCYVQYTTPSSAAAAVAALDKTEVAPGRALSVALSDPSRRKQRSDAGENAKELFVSGFPRNISEYDLKSFFEEFGAVTGVRLLRNAEGGLRGIGFVDFESALDATRAMREVNSTKWRGKTISVTIAENRGHATRADGKDRKARSVRVDGLPVDAQEALIQQAMERATGLGSVKQVLWRPDGVGTRATVEFRDVSDAGKAVLVGGAGGVKAMLQRPQ